MRVPRGAEAEGLSIPLVIRAREKQRRDEGGGLEVGRESCGRAGGGAVGGDFRGEKVGNKNFLVLGDLLEGA